MPKIVIKNDYIVLPVKLVEEVFPSTNATFIKVYTHILMLCAKGADVELSQVASDLQLLESDVHQAVRFWQGCGALEMSDNAENSRNNVQPLAENKVVANNGESYELSEITPEIESNSMLSEMLQLAQEVLGKPISAAETKTLYWIYDNLGFSPEVILMLLEYCVSIGKKSMQYIERVATSWHSKGINSMEEVEKFLSCEEHTKNYMNSLKSIFGIHDRSFTGIEEDYLKKWHDDLNMSEEMIALAYEYCILRTNKLSFPYMDKIIVDWSAKDIRTIEAAEAENEAFKKNKSGSTVEPDVKSGSFRNDELEKFTWDNMDE
ncbi:MAG: DnaD domain protein [Clostridia bacterium]|nr:DnaD domain protein [Clostridia bacterium]